MERLKLIASISVALGILSILCILLCCLALADIWQGEEDLSLEWQALRIGFLGIIIFYVSAFVVFFRLFGYLKTAKETEG